MITEMQKKMGGTIVEIVAPALIMIMTGSLAFFLVELFYYGSYTGRVKWVLGLFVFATVLVSRLSIMESVGKAVAYGFALSASTILVLSLLGSVNPLLGLLLTSVVIYVNNKLTWDCTVIDHTKDATDRGLLERVGLESHPNSSSTFSETDDENTSLENESHGSPETGSWTTRFFNKKTPPNTPGVWVIYLALAAFPIYGLGQGFITEEIRRQNAFFDFCLYLIGSLGLLVTTAMLGLQRYLVKRNATMPNNVAITWVGTGVVMIAAILIAAWILPRPYAEYSYAENPFKFESKSWWGASKNPVGTEGKKKGNSGGNKQEQSKSRGGNSQQKKSSSQQTKSKSDSRSDSRASRKASGKQSGGKQSQQSKSQQSKSQQSKSQQSKSQGNKSQGNKSQQSKQKNAKQPTKSSSENRKSGTNRGKPQNAQKSDSRNAKPDPKQTDQKNESKQSNEQNQTEKSRDSSGDNSEKTLKNSKEQSKNRQKSDSKGKSADAKSSSGRSKSSENESDEKSTKSNNSNSTNSSSSQSSSMRVPSFSGIIWIVQVLFWVVVAIAILYFAWRYRKELYESWLNFLEDLRNFWASLFGKKTRKHDGDRRDAKPTGPTERAVPFSDFSNPFTGGQASSMSQAQLIKYTFEALDAWGRERGITRGEDETPHEFAIALTGLDKSIARQAKILADHYCAMAFSQAPTIDPVIPQHLSNLWKSMTVEPVSKQPLQPA